MKNRQEDRRRFGMASMEMGLLLPFFFVLVMGIIEMGSMFSVWMTLQKAAQSGARFATTGIGDEEGNRLTLITQETEEWLVTLNGNKIVAVRSWPTVQATGGGVENNPGGPCELVEVEARYGYTPFTPLISTILPSIITLSGKERKLNEPWKPCDNLP